MKTWQLFLYGKYQEHWSATSICCSAILWEHEKMIDAKPGLRSRLDCLHKISFHYVYHVTGLVQDSGNSSAFALGLPQSCNKLLTCALLCFVMVCHWLIWPIIVRVTSSMMAWSWDCPSASEATMKYEYIKLIWNIRLEPHWTWGTGMKIYQIQMWLRESMTTNSIVLYVCFMQGERNINDNRESFDWLKNTSKRSKVI